jgi:mono/diheme cytochrome c family protein
VAHPSRAVLGRSGELKRVRPVRLFLSTAILPLILSVSGFASSNNPRARGETIFASTGCRFCHSIGNVGGHKGPDLSDVGRTMKKAAIRKQIMNGSRNMPAFGSVLSSSEIDDLVSYLRSCRNQTTTVPAR